MFAKAQKKRLAPLVGKQRMGGTLIEFPATEVTLNDRKAGERKLPVTAFHAKNLAIELKKHKQLRRGAAMLAWLDSLGGKPAKLALTKLDAADPLAVSLRENILAAADPTDGEAAAVLAQLQQLELPANPADAESELEKLRTLLTKHGSDPLWKARKEALRGLAKALAFRSFSLSDPACLGLDAKIEPLGKGRIRVRYEGSGAERGKDFEVAKLLSAELKEARPRLATSGRSLRAAGRYYLASGSGVFRSRLPTTGPTVVKASMAISGPGFYGVLLCADPNDGHIHVSIGGVTSIFDRPSRLSDSTGRPARLTYEQPAELVIRHDGKKQMQVSVDGARTSKLTDVAGRTHGIVAIDFHSSSPLAIFSFEIETQIDTSATTELRQRYVQRVLATFK